MFAVNSQFIDSAHLDVGTDVDYINIDSNGFLTMEGGARVWRDEITDALSIKVTGSGLSANTVENTVDFTSTANLSDYLYTNVQLNHDRDETSPIYPHLHWFQNQNKVPNLLLQYRWQILGGTKTTAWTNLRCNTTAFTYVSGTIQQLTSASTPITPPTGSDVSDIVQFRILRDTTNASGLFTGVDTYTGDLNLISFDVHILLNSIGSRERGSK